GQISLPDYSRLDSILAKHFDFGYDSWRFENVDSRDLRIAIQDSTDDWDAVDNLVIKLNNDGFWNVKVSKPWTQPLEVTRIVAQDGDTDGAEALQKALGFGKVVVESTGFLESDITIQLGRDWLEKSAQQEFEVDIDTEYEDTEGIDTEEREDFEDFQPRRRNRFN
ncbi:MAG: LytR C-terminal domain-containing protein, partial [Cyanobacteriota bacterium]|nr:LytR C-terminal domain-containing protein [Cyanobacteriota bacterium]